MGYSYAYEVEEFINFGLVPVLMSGVPSFLLNVAVYVLTALAVYTVAKRRGLSNPWLAWIPVADSWLLGSISDQYRYVVKGENRSKRKILLTLRILAAVRGIALFSLGIAVVANVISGAIREISEEQLLGQIMGPVIGMLGVCVPMAGISIAYIVIRFMALYDVYTSMDPGNSVMFLVLSIVFKITEPFFLFFNRNKDGGMPPRKQQPVYEQPDYQQYVYEQPVSQQPQEEPWDDQEKDYL